MYGIVKETCAVIWEVLSPLVMPTPTKEQWLEIGQRFGRKWNFPNCIGAVDGKHINIKAPPKSGSLYRNYKHFFSIVLMAVVDADYRFTMVDIGSYGSSSDSGVFNNSVMGKMFLAGDLDIPGPVTLPGWEDQEPFPHCLVGDEAFPLGIHMMKPYPGRGTGQLEEDENTFNYRLSRARRIVENAFGILAMRWQVFTGVMQLNPENATLVVQATTCLHNYLTIPGDDGEATLRALATTSEVAPENVPWQDLRGLGRRSVLAAQAVRNRFKRYFMSEAGALPFQREYALLQ